MYSLFIPCYNEENCLGSNVNQIYNVLKNYQKQDKHFDFEIIIINDCSKDRTKEIADKLSEKKEIRAIHYEGIKPTRRENLIRSFNQAKGEIIAFTDADLSTDIMDLPRLFKEVDKEKTIVVGDRYHPKSRVRRTKKRYFLSKSINYLTKLMFFDWSNPDISLAGSRDHFCGFKAFRKEDILELLEYTGIGNKRRSMWWDAEMLIYAERLGYNIKRIPVGWTEGAVTKLQVKRELNIIFYMLQLYWRMKWMKSTKLG